jgi:hypothetical protein
MNSHQSHKSYEKYKFEKRANTDRWIYQRWDLVPKGSKSVTPTMSPNFKTGNLSES